MKVVCGIHSNTCYVSYVYSHDIFHISVSHVIGFSLFQYLLLGAVPFPTDVPRLKALGVGGVVTLNEPYETLVPTSLYRVSLIYPLLFYFTSYHLYFSSCILYDIVFVDIVLYFLRFLSDSNNMDYVMCLVILIYTYIYFTSVCRITALSTW